MLSRVTTTRVDIISQKTTCSTIFWFISLPLFCTTTTKLKLSSYNPLLHVLWRKCCTCMCSCSLFSLFAPANFRAATVPNSIDRIKFDFSTAILAVLHGSSLTWFQTSCYRRAEPRAIIGPFIRGN